MLIVTALTAARFGQAPPDNALTMASDWNFARTHRTALRLSRSFSIASPEALCKPFSLVICHGSICNSGGKR